MKYRVLIIFSLLLILFCAFRFGPALAKSLSNSELYKIPINAEKLMQLVNEWRVGQGFQPYEKSGELCNIALKRSIEIQTNYSHDKFESDYASYPSVVQENINRGHYTELRSLTSWLDSPPHLATLEKPYKYSCIATQGNYAVQVFSNCEHGCPKERY